jgi:hypothetical protein
MGKYPYDASHWKAWKAGNAADAIDSETAGLYGDFAEAAIASGNDAEIALEAAVLGLTFGRVERWRGGRRPNISVVRLFRLAVP